MPLKMTECEKRHPENISILGKKVKILVQPPHISTPFNPKTQEKEDVVVGAKVEILDYCQFVGPAFVKVMFSKHKWFGNDIIWIQDSCI